jgi:hypothetical protein
MIAKGKEAASGEVRALHDYLGPLAITGAAVRNRELEGSFSEGNPDVEGIARGNKAVHGGDVLADALLYTAESTSWLGLEQRGDKPMFMKRYGVLPEVVVANRSCTKLLYLLNVHYLVTTEATKTNKKNKNGSKQEIRIFRRWYFHLLLARLIPAEGGSPAQSLDQNGELLDEDLERYHGAYAQGRQNCRDGILF